MNPMRDEVYYFRENREKKTAAVQTGGQMTQYLYNKSGRFMTLC